MCSVLTTLQKPAPNMPSLRSSGPSRTSSPFVPSAKRSPVPSVEPQKEQRPAESSTWVEPEPRPPALSLEDYGPTRGFGVLKNIQPLGMLPPAKLRIKLKNYNYLWDEDAASTPEEGTPAPLETVEAPHPVEPPAPTESSLAMPRHKVEDDDDEYRPSGMNGAASRSAKQPARNGMANSPRSRRGTSSRASPSSRKPSVFRSAFDENTLNETVEEAVSRFDSAGESKLGRAVQQLHQESQHDSNIAALIDAILLQNATPEQFDQYAEHLKRIKKQMKRNNKKAPRPENFDNSRSMPDNVLSYSTAPTIGLLGSHGINTRPPRKGFFISSSLSKAVHSRSSSPSETSVNPVSPISPTPNSITITNGTMAGSKKPLAYGSTYSLRSSTQNQNQNQPPNQNQNQNAAPNSTPANATPAAAPATAQQAPAASASTTATSSGGKGRGRRGAGTSGKAKPKRKAKETEESEADVAPKKSKPVGRPRKKGVKAGTDANNLPDPTTLAAKLGKRKADDVDDSEPIATAESATTGTKPKKPKTNDVEVDEDEIMIAESSVAGAKRGKSKATDAGDESDVIMVEESSAAGAKDGKSKATDADLDSDVMIAESSATGAKRGRSKATTSSKIQKPKGRRANTDTEDNAFSSGTSGPKAPPLKPATPEEIESDFAEMSGRESSRSRGAIDASGNGDAVTGDEVEVTGVVEKPKIKRGQKTKTNAKPKGRAASKAASKSNAKKFNVPVDPEEQKALSNKDAALASNKSGFPEPELSETRFEPESGRPSELLVDTAKAGPAVAKTVPASNVTPAPATPADEDGLTSGLSSPAESSALSSARTPTPIPEPAKGRKRKADDVETDEATSVDLATTKFPKLQPTKQPARTAKRPKTETTGTVVIHKQSRNGEVPAVYAGISPRKKGGISRRHTPRFDNGTTDRDPSHDLCDACGGDGRLICCDKCSNVFHFECADPPKHPEHEEALTNPFACNTCRKEDERDDILTDEDNAVHLTHKPTVRVRFAHPEAFGLDIVTSKYFEAVSAGPHGEYQDDMQNRKIPTQPPIRKNDWKNKGKNAAQDNEFWNAEEPEVEKILQAVVYCDFCGKSNYDDNRELIACDNEGCKHRVHMDCLNPPRALGTVYSNHRFTARQPFYCQLHTTPYLSTTTNSVGITADAQGQPKRVIKLRAPLKPRLLHSALSRGVRNNGNIEIILDESDDDAYDPNTQAGSYGAREGSIKLDWVAKVKALKQQQTQEQYEAAFEARVEAETQRRVQEQVAQQMADFQQQQDHLIEDFLQDPDRMKMAIEALAGLKKQATGHQTTSVAEASTAATSTIKADRKVRASSVG